MMTRKVKEGNANPFQNNETPERYLEKFLRNAQVAKQKKCGIWLDDRIIMSELKIKKVSYITWDTESSEEIEKKEKSRRRKCRRWCSYSTHHADMTDCDVRWKTTCQKEGTSTQQR